MPGIIRLLSVTLLTLTTAAAAGADTLSTPAAIDTHTGAFMTRVADGDVGAAYRSLRPYLGVPAEPYDASAEEARTYFNQVAERVGDTLAVSQARREAIGADFYRVTWLQKFDTAAIAWTFTFYQPLEGYKLVGVSYSTELSDLYRPVARAD
ncbi:MAG: hypothetical protein R3280_06180 [Marinobacter sp.]|uniref:hypothetical protein n=1 Tax=Marinobacter sp. TaxID=50741 RepID=UPI00299EFE43|nr:hypothetical protein [Marinobacter sp.]MDX1634203.1 hypothetical protein [Marinobacter sp.]